MTGSSGGSPEPLFFVPIDPTARPRQGEIIADLPWGLIESPLKICRPQTGRGAVQQAAGHEADKLESAFKKHEMEVIHARGGRTLGMIVWADCELDKSMEQERDENRWFAGVAPVMPLARFEEAIRPGIRASRRRSYFYLPANPTIDLPESYVDLRRIWSVKQSLFKQRVVALSEPAVRALQAHMYGFFTYQMPIDLKACPACGNAIKLFEPDNS